MNRTSFVALIAVTMAGLPACTFGFDSSDSGDVGSRGTELVVSDATLGGQLGHIDSFAAEADVSDAYSYGDFAYIEMHAEGSSWWAMNGITIEGGLDHPELVPGATLEFAATERYYGGETNLFIGVLGCSGPERGNWDYDRTADRVVVDVLEGANGARVLEWTGYYPAVDGGEGFAVDGAVTLN